MMAKLFTLLAWLPVAQAWSGHVTLKVAVDRFGAVDDLGGKSGRFTSPASLDCVHRLRRGSDAVLVGVSTVARDDPSLTVRRVDPVDGAQPLRVVLDPNGRAPRDATLLTDGLPTAVFSRGDFGAVDPAVTLEPFGELPTMLDALERDHGVAHLMVEGGPFTARKFLAAGLVDRAVIVRAPVVFERPVPSGIDAALLRGAGLAFHSRRDVGGDDTHTWTRPGAAPIWAMLLDGALVVDEP